MKCLSKQPGDRYPSARSLAEELRRFRADWAARKRSGATTPKSPVVVLAMQPGGEVVRLSQAINVIGRSPDCEVVLRASSVSKRHCQICVEQDAITVEDLGSANGTFVNGRQVERAALREGYQLRIDKYSFEVRLEDSRA